MSELAEHRFTLTSVIVRGTGARGVSAVEVKATHMIDSKEIDPLRLTLAPIKFHCAWHEAEAIKAYVYPKPGETKPRVCMLRECDDGRWELHPETSNGRRPFTIKINSGALSEVRP